MRTIVIDDDIITRTTLRKYIEKTRDLTFVKDFEFPNEAIAYLKNNSVDMVFLDIEMPETSGLEILRTIELPQVVVVSGKKEYAVDAFDFNVTDFLYKPISYERFLVAVDKANKIGQNFDHREDDPTAFFLKEGVKFVKVNIDDITYIEAVGDYVSIYTVNGRYTILSTMKNVEAKLKKFNFIRVHRSYIVNIKQIRKIEEDDVFIADEQLPISRLYKSDFIKKINVL